MAISRAIHLLVAFSLVMTQGAWAQVTTPLEAPQTPGSEFFVGKQFGKPLVTVNLISGVSRPGVYHVPVGTDLAQLLAYAGGATGSADLSEISIQRIGANEKPKLVEVDLDEVFQSTSTIPSVADRDIVHIEQKASLDSTVKWISLFSMVASIGLSLALLNDIQKRD